MATLDEKRLALEEERLDDLGTRLEDIVERLERVLLPQVPKSRRKRAAELGLRVVEDGDDDE